MAAVDRALVDSQPEPVVDFAYPFTLLSLELEQVEQIVRKGAAGFVQTIRNARVAFSQNDRR
ncbi:MAG: hypothetical protein JRG89_17940 [Deltaproteobacteria bacterium]|nr:hypothetical protein [Deltaproteobacteria bacterium]